MTRNNTRHTSHRSHARPTGFFSALLVLGRVGGAKTDAQAKDEAARSQVSGDINRIFDATKAETEAILNGLDALVTGEFDNGEAQARGEFTAKHKADMEKYKDKRYSGAAGWIRWGEDLFTGLPAEANKIYDDAKALYESKMTVVISTVADLIGKELDRAKARIAKGRQEIKTYIDSKPANLQKIAAEAGKEMSGKFDQLESDVDSKQQSLVDDLANKYVEARGKVDEEIKAEQESNKGLVDKAKDAVMGAIDTILKLKALFMGLLAKAASAFTKILDDPIKFISNFMSAVKQGFMSFASNILTHLKKGLLGWLFGALASAGIELPDSFDFKGILKLVGSILGLTWTNIKARIVKIAPWVGKVIDVIESKIEVFTILATQGIGGLWNWIKKQLSNLTELIITPIKDFVIEKIVTAGISWVLGMLNPAGALVKVVQALIGVVQWIMERGAALMDFVGTVIDAVSDIANGGVGGVPAKIEAALGQGRAAGDRVPGEPARPGRDLREDQVDPQGRAGTDQQGARFRDQGCAEAGRPADQGHQGHRRQDQGQGRRRQGMGEEQDREREGLGQGQGRQRKTMGQEANFRSVRLLQGDSRSAAWDNVP